MIKCNSFREIDIDPFALLRYKKYIGAAKELDVINIITRGSISSLEISLTSNNLFM